MKYAVIAARILLALPFLFFGANDLHPFFSLPLMPGDGGTLLTIMFHHGWFLFVGVLYVVAGVLLVLGKYVPVGLVLLGPILVVILLVHITLQPSGLPLPIVLTALEVFLIYANWPAFRGIFTA